MFSDSHKLHAVGWNEHGLCGTGDEVNVEKITSVSSLQGYKVTSLACGGHCYAITLDNQDNGW